VSYIAILQYGCGVFGLRVGVEPFGAVDAHGYLQYGHRSARVDRERGRASPGPITRWRTLCPRRGVTAAAWPVTGYTLGLGRHDAYVVPTGGRLELDPALLEKVLLG